MPRRRKPPSQNWRTFLDNHIKDLVSVDFFVVPTVFFRVLFGSGIITMIVHSALGAREPDQAAAVGPSENSHVGFHQSHSVGDVNLSRVLGEHGPFDVIHKSPVLRIVSLLSFQKPPQLGV
jgi:hypothetical protein